MPHEDNLTDSERLLVIETKLDMLLEGDQGIPARIAILEKTMNWARGAVALAAAFGTLLGALGGYALDRIGFL